MKYPFKKGISDDNNFLKKSRKVISILVVFLLLSTLLSTVVSAEGISSYLNNDTDEPESLLEKFFKGKSIKERLQETKEKIQARISEIKNKILKIEIDETVKTRTISRQSAGTSLLEALRTIISIKNSDSPLMFHTNYDGNIKSTEMRLFGTVNVDVNDDDLDDISARMLLYPFIERPLCLSIRFKLTITRLENFPDVNEDFSAYAELTFLGILSEKQKGNTLGFGYESPEDEEVPDKCVVTYKYLPHILSLERPEHRAEIDPGTSAGKDDLILFLQYTNYDGAEVSSQLISTIVYNPAVKSEINVWGTGLLGGSEYNFERTGSDNSNIDMYCSFTKNNTNIYGYVYDLPQKVTFNLDLGIDGFIEFNTHGEKVSEIGLNAELYDNENKIYFEDLPSKARLEWNHDIIFGGKANFSFYTEGEGISFKVHLEPQRGGMFDFSISSNENLDCSAELDTEEGYLIIDKTNIDISVLLSATGANNSIFQLSFNVSKDYVNPLEIYFDLSEKIEVTFANKFLVLTDLNLLVDLPSLNFGIIADKFVKNHSGNVTILIDRNTVGENVLLNVSFLLDNGVTTEIYGLKIGFNGNWTEFEQDPLILTRSWSFELSFLLSAFEYYVAEDWSWGYFCFKGDISYETYHLFSVMDIDGGVRGNLFAGSNEDGFNISWYTDTSKGYNLTKLSITGTVLGMEDFHFYLGDLIILSISSLTGTILVNEACNESGSVIFEFIGSQTNLDVNFEFNFSTVQEPKKGDENEKAVGFSTLMEDFHVDLYESTFTFEFNWADDSTSNIIILADTDINLSIGRFDLFFLIDGNETLIVQNMNGYIQGNSGIDVNLALPLNFAITNESTYFDFSEDTFAITLTDVNVYLSIDGLNIGFMEQSIGPMDLENIEISASATGKTSISFISMSIDTIKLDEETDITTVDITFGFDAKYGNLALNRFEIGNIQGIVNLILDAFAAPPVMIKTRFIIENISIVGYSELTIKAGIEAENFIIPYIGFKFVNAEGTYITMDNLSFIFYDFVDDFKEFLDIDLTEFLSEDIIEDLTENPPTIFLRDVHLVEDVFEFIVMPGIGYTMGFEIPDGSALENGDIVIEIPSLLEVVFAFDYPVDYFILDINQGWNNIDPPFNKYILFDTHNTTFTLDLSLVLTPEFVNLGIDLLNLPIPHAEYDQGIYFDNAILQADEFYIYTEESVSPIFDGFLHIHSGDISILINGIWEPLSPGEISITLYQGHLNIRFNTAIEDFPIYIDRTLETGERFLFSGDFSVNAPNLILDLWWTYIEDTIKFEKFEITGYGSINFEDFVFKIDDKIDLTWESLSVNGLPSSLYSVSMADINGRLTFNGSLGVSLKFIDFYLRVDPSVLDLGINATVEVPLLDVTFGAEGSELSFTLLPLILPLIIIPKHSALEVGETKQLEVYFALDPFVHWESSNSNIASVDGSGLVTAWDEGTVTITAQSGRKEATATVTVVKYEYFCITPKYANITIGKTLQLTPHKYKDPITWSSDNSDIASVDSTGLVAGRDLGEVIITATDALGAKATSNIRVVEPPVINETKICIKGEFILSGKLKIGLHLDESAEFFTFDLSLSGSLSLRNAYFKLVGPENLFLEAIIPNRLEIQDGRVELKKDDKTSPGIFSFGGIVNIYPGMSDDWGWIGFGIKTNILSDFKIPDFKITLESLYLDAGVGASAGEIIFEFDQESRRCELHSESEGISLDFANLKFIAPKLRVGIESLKWNKLGNIDWTFDFGPSEEFSGSYIKMEHYADYNSYLTMENFNLGFYLNTTISGIYFGWVDFPVIKSLSISKSKQGYESLTFEWLKDSHYIIHADMDSTWNCSIDVKYGYFGILQGLWEINSEVSSNWNLTYLPGDDCMKWIIHEPGLMRYFEIKHTYAILGYYALKVGPIQLTPGEIIIKWKSEVDNSWIEIDNQGRGIIKGIKGEGDVLTIDLTRSCSITIGTFEIDYGTLRFSWGIGTNSNVYNWIRLENDGMLPRVGLLKAKIGKIELDLLNLSLTSGETYVEFYNSADKDEGYISIDNTAQMNLTLFKLMWDVNDNIKFIDKVGVESRIQMNEGLFKISWEEPTDDKYDHKFIIKNGILEANLLGIIFELKDMKISFDRMEFVPNYDNNITVQLRLRGSKNNAIYVDTTDYLQINRFVIGITTDTSEFELDSIIDINIGFEECVIGFFDGVFNLSGNLTIHTTLRDFIDAILSFRWRDNINDDYQKINIHGFANSTKSNISIDATSCTEDITWNWSSFKLGKYEITGSTSLNAQSYFKGEIYVDLPDNPQQDAEGNWRIYIDNGNQSLSTASLKIVRTDKERGLDISVKFLQADKFWISGKCIYGIFGWRPKIGTIDWGGHIEIFDVDIIKIAFANYNWIPIWPWADGPVASFTYTPSSPRINQQITFDASSSSPQGEIDEYKWKWTSSDSWHSSGTNPIAYHTYTSEDSKTVTLKIIKGLQSDTCIKTINIGSSLYAVDVFYDGEDLFEGDPFTVKVTNTVTKSPVSDASVRYYQIDSDGNSDEITKKTDSLGCVYFTAFDVPHDYYIHYADAIAYVDVDDDGNVDAESDVFMVLDEEADIHGYVRDLVTHYGIPGAKVEADPGNHIVYSQDYPGEDAFQDGYFKLFVPQGTYDITASISGYQSSTIYNYEANQGGYHYLGNIYLPHPSYGGLRGTIRDASTGSLLSGVTVNVQGSGVDITTITHIHGTYPNDYPSSVHEYYSLKLLPGTYTVTCTKENYYTHSEQVTVTAGNVKDIDIDLVVEWILPTGYSDPSSDWNTESDAYDGYTSTFAESDLRGLLQGWQWTGDLELTVPSTSCDKIKFYALYSSSYIDQIRVSVYYSGSWHQIYEGSFSNKAWVTKNLGGTYSVTKAKVSFHLKGCITGTSAELYDFRFYKLATTTAESQLNVVVNSSTIYEGDTFSVQVTDIDTGDAVENAKITYEYKLSSLWSDDTEQTNPKYTNSSGIVTFVAKDQISSDIECRVIVKHTDYEDEIVYFNVYDKDSCFLAGTTIALADGTLKSIEDIRIGDLVRSYDTAGGEWKTGVVSEVFHHAPSDMTDYYLVLNDDLRVTPNHPIYVGNRWVTAGDLELGDVFGGNVITSIERVYERVPTFNFEVEPYHTYYVVWGENAASVVHNFDPDPGGPVDPDDPSGDKL